METIKICDYGMITHMSLDKEHIAKYSGVFVCEGMPIHGKKFFKEESVRVIDFMAGCYGKSVATYYLDEEDSQLFDSIKSLISHYQIQQLKIKYI